MHRAVGRIYRNTEDTPSPPRLAVISRVVRALRCSWTSALLAALFLLWAATILTSLVRTLAAWQPKDRKALLRTRTAICSQHVQESVSRLAEDPPELPLVTAVKEDSTAPQAETCSVPCPEPVVLPKVALLFLAPHGPGHEALWRHWLETAAAVLPDDQASVRNLNTQKYDSHSEIIQASTPACQHVRRVQGTSKALSSLSATLPEHVRQQLETGPGFNLTNITRGADLHPRLRRWPAWAYPWYRQQLSAKDAYCVPTNVTTTTENRLPLSSTSSPGQLIRRLWQRLVQGWAWGARVMPACLNMERNGGVLACWNAHMLGMGVKASEERLLDERVEELMAQVQEGNQAPTSSCVPYTQQELFSIYVHAEPGTTLNSKSVFAGRQVPYAISTAYGYAQPVLMQASLILLSEALRDPANVRFVLLSETTIPLLPAGLVWAELISGPRSRVDACRDVDMDMDRWRPSMSTSNLNHTHWRKSSQWWALTRSHAALAVADGHVGEIFNRYCYSRLPRPQCTAAGNVTMPTSLVRQPRPSTPLPTRSWFSWLTGHATAHHKPPRASASARRRAHVNPICVADEHFVPTLLASYGLDQETDCLGLSTFADWQRAAGSSHPHMFTPSELTYTLADRLRQPHDGAGRLVLTPTHATMTSAATQPAYGFGLGHSVGMVRDTGCKIAEAEASLQRVLRQAVSLGKTLNRAFRDAGKSSMHMNGFHYSSYAHSSRHSEAHAAGNSRGRRSGPEDCDGGNQLASTPVDMNRSPFNASIQNSMPGVEHGDGDGKTKQGIAGDAPSHASHGDDNRGLTHMDLDRELASWLRDLGYQPMSSRCSLFARKFSPVDALPVLHWALRCSHGLGLAHWCDGHSNT